MNRRLQQSLAGLALVLVSSFQKITIWDNVERQGSIGCSDFRTFCTTGRLVARFLYLQRDGSFSDHLQCASTSSDTPYMGRMRWMEERGYVLGMLIYGKDDRTSSSI